MEQAVLICHIFTARRKARKVAEAEVFYLLHDLDPQILGGGPLSEEKGVFWITIPYGALPKAKRRFHRLGYTQKIDIPIAVQGHQLSPDLKKFKSAGEFIRWRKQYHKLNRVYEANLKTIRDTAPDRRTFMLKLSDGEIQPVRGYRGDGRALSRRGLPPYDSRMLVNLVRPQKRHARILDPFAGVGGILFETINSGYKAVSTDNDPFLMYGLYHLGAQHAIADSRSLPFLNASVDAIATEPPYDKAAEEIVKSSLIEMARVLKHGSRLAIFCAAWQADGLREVSQSLELKYILDAPVNRKGTDCVVLAWKKIGENKGQKSH